MQKKYYPLAQSVHAESISLSDPTAANLQAYFPACETVLADQVTIHAQNLFRNKAQQPSAKEFTDDAAHVVYINGLPSVLIADGAFGSHHEPPQLFCNEIVPRYLPSVIEKLSTSGSDIHAVMREFFVAVNHEAETLATSYEHKGCAQFTFACALTYEDPDTGEMAVASVGTGSDAIAVYREGMGYRMLYRPVNLCHGTELDDLLSGGKQIPHSKIFLPLRDFSVDDIFMVDVMRHDLQPRDQLVAMTDGVFDGVGLERSKGAFYTDQKLVGILRSIPEDCDLKPSGFIKAADDAVNRAISNGAHRAGDDALYVNAVLPTAEKRNEIIAHAQVDATALVALKEGLIKTLKSKCPYRPSLFMRMRWGHHHEADKQALISRLEKAYTQSHVKTMLSDIWGDVKGSAFPTSTFVPAVKAMLDKMDELAPSQNAVGACMSV